MLGKMSSDKMKIVVMNSFVRLARESICLTTLFVLFIINQRINYYVTRNIDELTSENIILVEQTQKT